MFPPADSPARLTLRDLPLPAKLVVTAFLISVGLGYLWAMAQIHFKHASTGEPLPTQADLVARFSGVPWPLEPRPDPADEERKKDVAEKAQVGLGQQAFAVRIRSVLNERCAVCHGPGKDKADKPLDTYAGISQYLSRNPQHPKGEIHTVLVGRPGRAAKSFNKSDMSEAFFSESADWPTADDDKDAVAVRAAEQKQKAERPGREAERQAVLAWVETGGPKAAYDADAFALPPDDKFKDLTARFRGVAAPVAAAAPKAGPLEGAAKWEHAKSRQLKVEALTQSTHAHLLTFAVLWALTGFAFSFTRYPLKVRIVLAPVVLIAQVVDVFCWWLARLEPPAGPYFALAIMGTGTVVGVGLVLQIVLSLWDMYGLRGRLMLAVLFLAIAGLFGLAFVKVIQPQIQEEKDFVAKQQQGQ
jgi:mono/diheme cytochrome c family protein